MKKLLLILFMVFAIAFTAFADDKVETLRFTYKQDAATLSVMSGWQLHWSDVSGSGYVKATFQNQQHLAQVFKLKQL
jgi:hypothetical protein